MSVFCPDRAVPDKGGEQVDEMCSSLSCPDETFDTISKDAEADAFMVFQGGKHEACDDIDHLFLFAGIAAKPAGSGTVHDKIEGLLPVLGELTDVTGGLAVHSPSSRWHGYHRRPHIPGGSENSIPCARNSDARSPAGNPSAWIFVVISIFSIRRITSFTSSALFTLSFTCQCPKSFFPVICFSCIRALLPLREPIR